MKIAVLTEVINRKSGSRAPLEIAKSLSLPAGNAGLRNEIVVFAYAKNLEKEATDELKASGITIETIKNSKLLAPFIIFEKLKKNKFEVISFHGTLPFFLGAKLSGIPIVRTYYGTQLDPLLDKAFPDKPNILVKLINKSVNQLIKLQEKFIIKNSNQTIAISKYTRKELLDLYGLKGDYVYLGSISPAQSTARLPARQVKQLNSLPAQAGSTVIKILSVSRIVPYKGFHRLIKIFNKLNIQYFNMKLTIIGSSPNQKYLKYLKSISSKNVKFLINASDLKLQASYKEADIYATFDRYMFFGMPVVEAASFAIPAIAANFAAASEVIDHGKTGFVANSYIEFKNYLKLLVDSPALRIKMGKEAQKWAKKFSWEKTALEYERIFLRFRSK